jgi:hypothetical protein
MLVRLEQLFLRTVTVAWRVLLILSFVYEFTVEQSAEYVN